MSRILKVVSTLALVLALAFGLAACSDGQSSGQVQEQASGQSNYDYLARQQPAESVKYSSTRETINFFTRTWGTKGKTAYVYLMNNSGDVLGYYVTVGRPVSMCVSIRPTYQFVGTPDDGDNAKNQQVPAPGADGAYYSGSECNQYYARDANDGSYIEFTAGMGINPIIFDQPHTDGPFKGVVNLNAQK